MLLAGNQINIYVNRIHNYFLYIIGRSIYLTAMIHITQKATSEFTFSVLSKNGSALLESVAFKTKEEVNKIVIEVTKYGIVERATTYGGSFQYKLKTPEGKLLGKSLNYGSEAGMENGIKHFQHAIKRYSNENNTAL